MISVKFSIDQAAPTRNSQNRCACRMPIKRNTRARSVPENRLGIFLSKPITIQDTPVPFFRLPQRGGRTVPIPVCSYILKISRVYIGVIITSGVLLAGVVCELLGSLLVLYCCYLAVAPARWRRCGAVRNGAETLSRGRFVSATLVRVSHGLLAHRHHRDHYTPRVFSFPLYI